MGRKTGPQNRSRRSMFCVVRCIDSIENGQTQKKKKKRERERQKQRQRQIAEERHRKTRTWVKNRQKKNPEINTSGDFWGSAYRRGEIETERDRIREREREKKKV
jgi:methionine salvage enolase-phosphatase E1